MTDSPGTAPTSIVEQRRARGQGARRTVPHEAHAELPTRPVDVDPVGLLEGQAVARVPELVPLRYGRMLQSPFSFYRGAALIMADDLASVPNTGLHVQLCGDAHVGNFWLFASYERRLVFDVNDFDETHPGPFEWDLKRLAASMEVAGRENGFSPGDRRRTVLAMSKAYRKAMRGFTEMGEIDLWYARLDVLANLEEFRRIMDKAAVKHVEKTVKKSMSRDRWQAAAKTTETVDGLLRFRSDPPLLVPVDELYPADNPERIRKRQELQRQLLGEFVQSLDPARQHLCQQYQLVDAARKVVGVGSVGTRAWVFLMIGPNGNDPLVMQAKQAQASVLEYALKQATARGVTVGAPEPGTSSATVDADAGIGFSSQGERVVRGQRIMQATGDMLLGWHSGTDRGLGDDYYVRQMRDWKGSFDVERFQVGGLEVYGRYCAWILARSHARSGDRFAIDTYLRKGRGFDEALADFALAYADRNELDHAALADAAASGRTPVTRDL